MTQQPPPNLPPPYPQPGQMPPVYFPPPMFYPPPPRERGGFARAIFTTLAVSILGFSITLNIYLLIAQGLFSGESGTGIKKETLTSGDIQTVIAVVPVEGVIWGASADDLDKLLDEIEADPAVKAVVLEIDSPGGEVTASDEMYNRLLRFKAEKKIPVITSMQGYAASGGYYIACATDQIVAQSTTSTGSIGVLWGGINVAELMNKYGVKEDFTVSTGSTLKTAGSPYHVPTPDELAYRQKLVDAHMALFKSVVATGRKLDQASVDRLATGQIFLGPDAKSLKLVDDVGFLDDAVRIASKKAGLSGAQVVRYTREVSFWESLAGQGQSRASRSNLVQAEVGNMKVSIDPHVLSDLLSPRPMFLCRGQ